MIVLIILCSILAYFIIGFISSPWLDTALEWIFNSSEGEYEIPWYVGVAVLWPIPFIVFLGCGPFAVIIHGVKKLHIPSYSRYVGMVKKWSS